MLPSYSFPLYTVELELPLQKQKKQMNAHLRLQRDLSYAIREYAPGSEVVADKRLWKSAGLRFYQEAPKSYEYRLCQECNQLLVENEPGRKIEATHCPTCGTAYNGRSSWLFVTPDGFRVDPKSGKPAGQYVRREPSQMRSALLLKVQPDMEALGEYIEHGYAREGRLFYVNEGRRGSGFRICKKCGASVSAQKPKCPGSYRGGRCESTDFENWMLGHLVTTDTLHLRFVSSPHVRLAPGNSVFWQTLLHALIQGAVHALQIERRDIDGLLYPINVGGAWETTIVLFDNVPGGAGHVRDIRDHFAEVVKSAYQIVLTCDCAPETSCIRCLRDYNNQNVYSLLRRESVIRFLDILSADLTQHEEDLGGATRVRAVNPMRWLMQQVSYARDKIVLAADRISDDKASAERESWLDLLDTQLRRGVDIKLVLTDLPIPRQGDHKALALARRLMMMMERGSGLKLFLASRLPEWHVITDPDGERRRAVKIDGGHLLELDGNAAAEKLITSSREDIVGAAFNTMQKYVESARRVQMHELEPPPNVRVEHIRRSRGKQECDLPIIREFFARPVKAMFIHDRYLHDEERLFHRVGAYIELALEGGALDKVTVHTTDPGAGRGGEEQKRALNKLERRYPMVKVQRKPFGETEHDRWIEVERTDGSKARMLIGRGLDFIHSDGTVKPTWIVVEDPA